MLVGQVYFLLTTLYISTVTVLFFVIPNLLTVKTAN